MTNFWHEYPEFWKNKTLGNPHFEGQKKELIEDVLQIIHERKIERVIDVGGYDGVVGTMLPDGIEYVNLDMLHGFDVTKPWKDQEGMKTIKKDKTTLVITSVVLICIPPEDLHSLFKEMRKYGHTFYFYEEKYRPELGDGAQESKQYGGKWNYDWRRLFNGWGKWEYKDSAINPAWIRIIQTL